MFTSKHYIRAAESYTLGQIDTDEWNNRTVAGVEWVSIFCRCHMLWACFQLGMRTLVMWDWHLSFAVGLMYGWYHEGKRGMLMGCVRLNGEVDIW